MTPTRIAHLPVLPPPSAANGIPRRTPSAEVRMTPLLWRIKGGLPPVPDGSPTRAASEERLDLPRGVLHGETRRVHAEVRSHVVRLSFGQERSQLVHRVG